MEKIFGTPETYPFILFGLVERLYNFIQIKGPHRTVSALTFFNIKNVLCILCPTGKNFVMGVYVSAYFFAIKVNINH